MIVKVCGMKYPDNISELVKLQPDYIGFIFYPGSKRYVGAIDPEIFRGIPGSIRKTGVFVNEDPVSVADIAARFALDAVQLHGDEPPEYCRVLNQLLGNTVSGEKKQLIKAFGVSESFNFDTLNDYSGLVDLFLFDTKTLGFGGSGLAFDWKVLERYKGATPYLLSGGLGPENIAKALEIDDERMAGVDLNSRFETEPGRKDIVELKNAIKIIDPGREY